MRGHGNRHGRGDGCHVEPVAGRRSWVAARALFGSCRYIVETLLPRYGIETTLVDGRDTDAWEQAMRPTTKVMFLETPSNPVLEGCDMQAVAESPTPMARGWWSTMFCDTHIAAAARFWCRYCCL
ncbi:MAG: hypothetical protein CM15mP21_5310 [Hyphomicrobiales bacterium]|nr:MAG: hypothetical protein CM15mP21_5310 [Hyphomicrobiales bacterium]